MIEIWYHILYLIPRFLSRSWYLSMHSKIQGFYLFIKILHHLSKFDLLSGINIQYLTNDDGKKDIMALITKPDWWTITIHFNVYDQGWRPMTNDLPFMIYRKSWARTLNYKTRIQLSYYVYTSFSDLFILVLI